MSLVRPYLATLCLLALGCGSPTSVRDASAPDASAPDAGHTPEDAGTPNDPDGLRALVYLNQRRCDDDSADCSVHDAPCGTGVGCTTLRAGARPYDLGAPPPPANDRAEHDYPMRWVPLCRDGTGDHEWTLDHAQGVAPSCVSSDFIRCGDGTRPLYYADSASEGEFTDGVERWVLWAGDGGGWAAGPTSEALLGQVAFIQYVRARTQAFTSSGRSYERPALRGMFNPSLTGMDLSQGERFFARFTNRVFINKCTPDNWLGERTADFGPPTTAFYDVRLPAADERGRSDGQLSECLDNEDADGDGNAGCCQPGMSPCVEDAECACGDARIFPPAGGYQIFFHGRLIIDAVLADLGRPGGIRTYASYDLDSETETFPQLDGTAGEQVVFVSGSNGTNGHYVRIDSLAAAMPDADVRAVFGQYFPPRIEVEHAIDVSPPDSTITDGTRSSYDHVLTGTSLTGYDLSLATLSDGGGLAAVYDDWGVTLDASCVAAAASHSSTDPNALCRESVHVAMNHLSTPAWVYMGQRDALLGASAVLFHAPCCADGAAGPVACDYVAELTEDQRRAAIRKQLADLAVRNASAEEGDYSRLVVFSPNVVKHGGLTSDEAAGYSIGGMRQAALIVGWLTDVMLGGYCMTDWDAGRAPSGNSNLELTGSADPCVLRRP